MMISSAVDVLHRSAYLPHNLRPLLLLASRLICQEVPKNEIPSMSHVEMQHIPKNCMIFPIYIDRSLGNIFDNIS